MLSTGRTPSRLAWRSGVLPHVFDVAKLCLVVSLHFRFSSVLWVHGCTEYLLLIEPALHVVQ
jgi:hypothetical protein